MKRLIAVCGLATLAAALPVCSAQAGLINFESGFVDLQPVGVVATGDNVVTFSIDGVGPGYIAESGPAPRSAFAFQDHVDGDAGGQYFLTDELAPNMALRVSGEYWLDFALPILDIELDIFDYRGDGGGPGSGNGFGRTVTLTAYADAARTIPVGSDSFSVPFPRPVDGNVVTLSVLNPTLPIVAVTVSYDIDTGTAIDNISFQSVPEPSTIALLGLGAIGFVMAGRRYRRSKCR